MEWAWEKVKTAEKIASFMQSLRIGKTEETPVVPGEKLNHAYEYIQREKERFAKEQKPVHV